jgi:hypothetical protein
MHFPPTNWIVTGFILKPWLKIILWHINEKYEFNIRQREKV